ncbi:MAG: acetyl-CoA C-acetyltransferase [Deltaproteobacteria bacterium]|nr:acetyl-CoA C-acetyltransferase [Deltaproteobacteria bacterium]
MREAVIVSGARTAVGSFGGTLKSVSAVQLGSIVIKDVLKNVKIKPKADKSYSPATLKDKGMIELETKAYDWSEDFMPVEIDEVIMGNVLTAGLGQNPARQAMIKAGILKETPAYTINKVCASGLKAVALAAASIMSGGADVIIAGGQENMSLAPMALPKARWGHRMELTGVGDIYDLMVFDGLYEIFYGYHMGMTAENIASMYNISRQEQDELGLLSHNRAMAAIKEGLFEQEISSVVIKGRKGDIVVKTDERPMETTIEKMSGLRPAFKKDGTVTAGNASGINDGAAALCVMSADKAKELGLAPIVKIKSFASGAIDPAYMGLGLVPAVKKALKLAGMELSDIQLIELNEAFASQAIGCMRELKIATDKPNELGSGISLGHPIGATGARQLVTGANQMIRKDYSTGLITMCIGGGMGMAMIVER